LDIAILRLSEDAPISHDLYPACLPKNNKDRLEGRSVQGGGWGNLFGPDRIYNLVQNKILTKTDCDELQKEYYQMPVDDEIICTEVKSRIFSYIFGDSGGKYFLIFQFLDDVTLKSFQRFGCIIIFVFLALYFKKKFQFNKLLYFDTFYI
jgi:hypothetical protein